MGITKIQLVGAIILMMVVCVTMDLPEARGPTGARGLPGTQGPHHFNIDTRTQLNDAGPGGKMDTRREKTRVVRI